MSSYCEVCNGYYINAAGELVPLSLSSPSRRLTDEKYHDGTTSPFRCDYRRGCEVDHHEDDDEDEDEGDGGGGARLYCSSIRSRPPTSRRSRLSSNSRNRHSNPPSHHNTNSRSSPCPPHRSPPHEERIHNRHNNNSAVVGSSGNDSMGRSGTAVAGISSSFLSSTSSFQNSVEPLRRPLIGSDTGTAAETAAEGKGPLTTTTPFSSVASTAAPSHERDTFSSSARRCRRRASPYEHDKTELDGPKRRWGSEEALRAGHAAGTTGITTIKNPAAITVTRNQQQGLGCPPLSPRGGSQRPGNRGHEEQARGTEDRNKNRNRSGPTTTSSPTPDREVLLSMLSEIHAAIREERQGCRSDQEETETEEECAAGADDDDENGRRKETGATEAEPGRRRRARRRGGGGGRYSRAHEEEEEEEDDNEDESKHDPNTEHHMAHRLPKHPHLRKGRGSSRGATSPAGCSSSSSSSSSSVVPHRRHHRHGYHHHHVDEEDKKMVNRRQRQMKEGQKSPSPSPTSTPATSPVLTAAAAAGSGSGGGSKTINPPPTADALPFSTAASGTGEDGWRGVLSTTTATPTGLPRSTLVSPPHTPSPLSRPPPPEERAAAGAHHTESNNNTTIATNNGSPSNGYELLQLAMQQLQLRQHYFEREQEKHLNALRSGFVELCHVVKQELAAFQEEQQQQQQQQQQEGAVAGKLNGTTRIEGGRPNSVSRGTPRPLTKMPSLQDYRTNSSSSTSSTSTSSANAEGLNAVPPLKLSLRVHPLNDPRKQRCEDTPTTTTTTTVNDTNNTNNDDDDHHHHQQQQEEEEEEREAEKHGWDKKKIKKKVTRVVRMEFQRWLREEAGEEEKALLAEALWPWLQPKMAAMLRRDSAAGETAEGHGKAGRKRATTLKQQEQQRRRRPSSSSSPSRASASASRRRHRHPRTPLNNNACMGVGVNRGGKTGGAGMPGTGVSMLSTIAPESRLSTVPSSSSSSSSSPAARPPLGDAAAATATTASPVHYFPFSSPESVEAHLRAVIRKVLAEEDERRWDAANASERRYQQALKRQDRVWAEALDGVDRRGQQALTALEVRLRSAIATAAAVSMGGQTPPANAAAATTTMPTTTSTTTTLSPATASTASSVAATAAAAVAEVQRRLEKVEVNLQALATDRRSGPASPAAALSAAIRKELQSFENEVARRVEREVVDKMMRKQQQQQEEEELEAQGGGQCGSGPSGEREKKKKGWGSDHPRALALLVDHPANTSNTTAVKRSLPHSLTTSPSTSSPEIGMLSDTTAHVRRLMVTHQHLVDSLVRQRCEALEGQVESRLQAATRASDGVRSDLHHLRQEVRRWFTDWGRQLDLAVPGGGGG